MLGLSVGLSLKISENRCYRLDKVNWFRAPLSVWDAQENDSRFSLARSGNLLEPHWDPCAARRQNGSAGPHPVHFCRTGQN